VGAEEFAMNKISFANLSQFLEGLGFTHRLIPGSHHLFEHARADTFIMLRLYEPHDMVEQTGLLSVRHTLDEWEIMEREQFDERIRQLSLVG
jgi:predicted RNA binding protein YcfA (HicA-like mRNA interferase family)